MEDLIIFGEITLDTIATTPRLMPSESVSILDLVVPSFGGRGANVATYAQNQGAQTILLSAAGRDFVSSGYRDQLTKRGINCKNILIDDENTTPKAFVFRDKNITHTFFYPGVTETREPEIETIIERVSKETKAKIVYCTSGLQKANLHLLRNLDAELKVYSPGPEINHYSPEELAEFLKTCNCLFLNEHEANNLRDKIGLSPREINEQYDLRFHVVTLGSHGSLIYDGSTEIFMKRCKPDRVVDATGAGDSYAGTFLAEYLSSHSLRKSGERASVVSSFVVEQWGCQTNIPTKDQIEARLQTYCGGN